MGEHVIIIVYYFDYQKCLYSKIGDLRDSLKRSNRSSSDILQVEEFGNHGVYQLENRIVDYEVDMGFPPDESVQVILFHREIHVNAVDCLISKNVACHLVVDLATTFL